MAPVIALGHVLPAQEFVPVLLAIPVISVNTEPVHKELRGLITPRPQTLRMRMQNAPTWASAIEPLAPALAALGLKVLPVNACPVQPARMGDVSV